MSKGSLVSNDLINDIKAVGIVAFQSWLAENGLKVGSVTKNFFEDLDAALHEQTISIADINNGLAELEENGDKRIRLLQALDFETLTTAKKDVLKHLRAKYGFSPTDRNWIRQTPGDGPTFNYMFWGESELKIKFSERHYDFELDMENDKMIRIPKKVNVIILIDLADGFTQLRFDAAGTYHIHRNDAGKPTESAFQNYYEDLLANMFPDVLFQDLDLRHLANHIASKERKRFRMNKEVTTITGNSKQTFSAGTTKTDVRDLPEHTAAVATESSKTWLTEDLTGYWLAEHSENELKKNLFMRISRRVSEIRVQRGCLEKELNYGLRQIREIQNAV